MRYRVVKLLPQRNIPLCHIIVIVRTHQVLCTGQCSRFIHGLVSQIHIKIAQALHPGINNHRNTRVTLHGQCFATIQFPFRQPSMFAIHIQHGTYHFNLTFRIYQCKQLMHIAIRIPKREHGIAVALCCQNTVTFHRRILAVYILQNIRMNQQMIQGRIKDFLLSFCTTLYGNTCKVAIPLRTCIRQNLFKILAFLLNLKVQTRIFHADKGNPHLHFHLLSFLCVEREIDTDIITSNFFIVAGIQFILALIRIPFGLYPRHRTLFLPIAGRRRHFLHPHYKIDRKHSLRIVTERTQQFHTFHFRITHPAKHRTAFVGKSFTQIKQDMTLPFGERKTSHSRTRCSSHFRLYVILRQEVGIIARSSLFIRIFTAIFLIIHIQIACCRHQQQRTQFRAPHSTQIHMRIASKKAVGILIRSRPPARILVIRIVCRPHYVEWNHRHHTVGTNGTGMCRSKVGSSYKRIDIIHR